MCNETLTENGIVSDHPDVTMENYTDYHGAPVVENGTVVIFRDDHGNELGEWADLLGAHDLREQMHELAREHYGNRSGRGPNGGDPWSVSDPIVFNAKTFE